MDPRLERGDSLTGADSAEDEGREEGDPLSKQHQCEDHDGHPRPGTGPGPGPGPSCVSLKSDHSVFRIINFSGRAESAGPRIYQESGVDCESLKNDPSMGRGIDYKAGVESPEERVDQNTTELLSGQQHLSHEDSTRQRLKEKFLSYVDRVWWLLSPDDPEPPESEEEEQWRSIREEFVKITVHLLRNMEEEDLAERLWSRSGAPESGHLLKRRLQKQFYSVCEGVTRAGSSVPLNQIYTELYITEGGTDLVNQEHEVRQMEAATRKQSRPETTIRQEDLFKASPDTDLPIRSLLTKGVAGIGKTLLTQKLTLDWAEGKAHQNFQLIFPFTFRELNLLKEKKLSLVELVHLFFPEAKESGLSSFEGVQVLFILDGLDESRLPLDFNSRVLTEATESTSVDILLTNLIRGKLLPSAQLWITTRPAAANQIPPECVDMVTEVRGFTDLQKEEYFRKRFRRQKQTTIISHIRSSRSLYIMCHIPIFCWITATVLEDMLKSRETGELPKTLTEMYIHFLVVQAKVKKLKYHGGAGTDTVWDPESRKMMESLGKLAFEQLQRGNLIFYESDLTECGMDITAAALYSGVFTQIFREERGLYQDKVFCFVHLSLQEFLAAFHIHLTFTHSGVILLGPQDPSQSEVRPGLEQFYQTAVVQTLGSPNGHLDLFLRFLLGLSLQTNQTLLRGLLPQIGSSSWTNEDTSAIIKKKLDEGVSPERTMNLFHCLNELKDTSLVEMVQHQLRSGRLSRDTSPADWSAVAFILLSSEEPLDVFDLNKYSASEEVFLRLMPVVRASNEVLLRSCGLSEGCCSPLSSVLSSPSSRLTQLDLSLNDLQDSGVELLCAGLESPDCHLETLRLRSCGLSDRSCAPLSSVLSSPSSRLTQLDLSLNDLQDPGVKLLCAGLEGPHCHLETLRLSGCLVSEEGCASLASALSSNPSHLRELDLSYNHPGGPGLELLSAGLENPDWRLETLRVDHGGEQRLRRGLLKYICPLTLDPDTTHQRLLLSNSNRTVRDVTEDQKYPQHPDRFNRCPQVLGREALTGRCYWEVARRGEALVSVTYRRNRGEEECWFGGNDQSWSLHCSGRDYSVYHNGTRTWIRFSSDSQRVGVFVDCPAGSVSFYSVSSDARIHLHTIFTSFTRPLYPGLGLWTSDSSLTLCDPTEFVAG
ncbi:NLR family CARD domain-containing protein 3-like [Synchiropus splendidus]|uniref:NLR family CARD domain-containing protein 3-like n=1 Tax=Synchiropus splendidus TaxID=270530 RepID=UPI00237E31C2|nr:NLR family CARD domain-containing protein 3-like [Synchiropus splendidus]